jgi:GntR family transcriptional regulator, carbon starvation induced regulator
MSIMFEPRLKVSSETLTRLRAEILTGRIMPGEKINLEQLKVRFQMSLSPLREALARLVAEGLVLQSDQRGFQVAPVSRHNLDEVTLLRQTLEAMALREAIRLGDDAWEADIVATLHRLSKLSPRDPSGAVNEEWEHWHREFHISMLSGCRSSVTLQFCETLLDLSDRYRRLFPPPTPTQRKVHREHQAIAEAALARDADRACEIIKEHIRCTRTLIESGLPKDMPIEQTSR